MIPKLIFQTPRLKAFQLNEANKHHVIKLYNAAENIEFLEGIDVIKDIELVFECYERYGGIGAYLLFKNDSDEFVGFGGVQRQEPMADGTLAMSDSDIEFLIIIEKKFSGIGFASEFCEAFFQKFFTQHQNLPIVARISGKNLSCIKLLKKFGFVEIGETDYHVYGNKFSLLRLSCEDLKIERQAVLM